MGIDRIDTYREVYRSDEVTIVAQVIIHECHFRSNCDFFERFTASKRSRSATYAFRFSIYNVINRCIIGKIIFQVSPQIQQSYRTIIEVIIFTGSSGFSAFSFIIIKRQNLIAIFQCKINCICTSIEAITSHIGDSAWNIECRNTRVIIEYLRTYSNQAFFHGNSCYRRVVVKCLVSYGYSCGRNIHFRQCNTVLKCFFWDSS